MKFKSILVGFAVLGAFIPSLVYGYGQTDDSNVLTGLPSVYATFTATGNDLITQVRFYSGSFFPRPAYVTIIDQATLGTQEQCQSKPYDTSDPSTEDGTPKLFIKDIYQSVTGGGTFIPYDSHIPCVLVNGMTYNIYPSNTQNEVQSWRGIASSTVYFETAGTGGFTDVTRIVDVSPKTTTPETVIATSTQYEVTGFIYINPNDYVDGMKFIQTIFINSPAMGSLGTGAFTVVDALNETVTFEYAITQSGYIDENTYAGSQVGLIATTSSSVAGRRHMISKITKPSWSVLGLNFGSTEVTYREDYYVVGTTTLGDLQAQNIVNEIAGLAVATSTVENLERCNPIAGNFSMGMCLYGLFIPSDTDSTRLISNFKDSFLRKEPWGYAYRVYQDISEGVSTSTLPSLSYTFGTSTPAGIAGRKLDFTPWLLLMGSTSPMAIQYGAFLDTFTTWFNTIWLIGFGFVLIKEFFGHEHGYSHEHSKKEKT